MNFGGEHSAHCLLYGQSPSRHCRDIRPARVRRDLPMPAHYPWNRAENGIRAGDFHRHRRFPEPRQAGVVLRIGAAQPPIRDFGVVGVGVPAGRQAPEEPPHILVQLPGTHGRPLGRVLRQVPRPRHAARQGAQGRREKEAEGDLRGREGQGPVRRVGFPQHRVGCRGPPGFARACPNSASCRRIRG